MDKALTQEFQQIVGPEYVISNPAEMAPYGIDRTTLWDSSPGYVVRPKSIEQVQQIVRLANGCNLSLVPSGGRTGYSGGAVAKDGEVVVTLERMNRILHFSAPDQSVTCEAGVITQHLQEFARRQGLFYPVSLASEGSCHIGGNVATNAGGIHVIRYGGTREQVTGLKVVTGNGDILDLNHGLIKNNCGPDLRHIFIGSEGIFGFICEVTVRLQPAPPPQTVMMVSANKITDLLHVFQAARKQLTLSAFEFMSRQAIEKVEQHTGQQYPFNGSASCYGLLEFDTVEDEQLTGFFSQCQSRGILQDAIVGQSIEQGRELWQLRENISESLSPFAPLKHDVSVRLEKMAGFIERLETLFAATFPEVESVWFGHLGDGNIHVNVLNAQKKDQQEVGQSWFDKLIPDMLEAIYALVVAHQGSISAEHGVGLLKREHLKAALSEAELGIGKQARHLFDSNGVMNPGKVY